MAVFFQVFGDFCYIQYVQKYIAKFTVKSGQLKWKAVDWLTDTQRHTGTDAQTDLQTDSHTT